MEKNEAPSMIRGERLPVHTVENISPDALKLVAALMDDPNPIHFDAHAVRIAGLGDRPVVQGPMTFGYMLISIGKVLGDYDGIRSSRIRFLGNLFAGDTLECNAEVDDIDAADGTISFRGNATSAGRAIAAIEVTVAPSRTLPDGKG